MKPRKSGIGGWLALFAFGLVAAPFFSAFSLYDDIFVLRSPLVTDLHSFLLIDVIILSLFMVFQLYVATAFFRHKSATPKLVIALLLAPIFIDIIEAYILALAFGVRPVFQEASIRALFIAAIWIPYFLLSERVTATFVVGGKGPLVPNTDSYSDTAR